MIQAIPVTFFVKWVGRSHCSVMEVCRVLLFLSNRSESMYLLQNILGVLKNQHLQYCNDNSKR